VAGAGTGGAGDLVLGRAGSAAPWPPSWTGRRRRPRRGLGADLLAGVWRAARPGDPAEPHRRDTALGPVLTNLACLGPALHAAGGPADVTGALGVVAESRAMPDVSALRDSSRGPARRTPDAGASAQHWRSSHCPAAAVSSDARHDRPDRVGAIRVGRVQSHRVAPVSEQGLLSGQGRRLSRTGCRGADSDAAAALVIERDDRMPLRAQIVPRETRTKIPEAR
jgi:hypothetical protein